MTKLAKLREKWMNDPEFRTEYEALDEEFALARALVDARSSARLTQAEVASRMATTQAYVARMEGLTVNPSISTLRRFARATGTRLRISFEPEASAMVGHREVASLDAYYTPGQRASKSGQYEVTGPRGGRTSVERTVVRNEPLPPTEEKRQRYKLVDQTKHRPKR